MSTSTSYSHGVLLKIHEPVWYSHAAMIQIQCILEIIRGTQELKFWRFLNEISDNDCGNSAFSNSACS